MRTELIAGLRALLASDEDCEEAVRLVAGRLAASGADAEIEEDDDGPSDNGAEGTLWVVSAHRLLVDGERVAEWTRCSMGTYGRPGVQCSDDDWYVSEDTEGGDRLPRAVEAALDALGLKDDLPDVPEPRRAGEEYDEDADGDYAVYWETVGDDAHVVARYASREAAEAVCAQRNRELSARHPASGGTTYLCGYGVRERTGGRWERVDDDA